MHRVSRRALGALLLALLAAAPAAAQDYHFSLIEDDADPDPALYRIQDHREVVELAVLFGVSLEGLRTYPNLPLPPASCGKTGDAKAMHESIARYAEAMETGRFAAAERLLADLRSAWGGCYSAWDFESIPERWHRLGVSRPYVFWPAFYMKFYRLLSDRLGLGPGELVWPPAVWRLTGDGRTWRVVAARKGGDEVSWHLFDDRGRRVQDLGQLYGTWDFGDAGGPPRTAHAPAFLGGTMLADIATGSSHGCLSVHFVRDGALIPLKVDHALGGRLISFCDGGGSTHAENCALTGTGAACSGFEMDQTGEKILRWKGVYTWNPSRAVLVETSYEERVEPREGADADR